MNLIVAFKSVAGKIRKIVYRMIPHSTIFVLHHLESQPPVCVSGCILDKEKFYAFVSKHSKTLSIPDILAMKFPHGNFCGYTFDDGLEDVYRIAYPYLKEKNIPFTIFVLTRMLDTPGYLTREQLLELNRDPLVTIGSHGTEHRVLSKVSEEACREEIFDGKKELEQIIGKKVDIFAYSHGGYNDRVIELLKEAGYKYGFTVRGVPYNIFEKNSRYTIPRCNIENTTLEVYM